VYTNCLYADWWQTAVFQICGQSVSLPETPVAPLINPHQQPIDPTLTKQRTPAPFVDKKTPQYHAALWLSMFDSLADVYECKNIICQFTINMNVDDKSSVFAQLCRLRVDTEVPSKRQYQSTILFAVKTQKTDSSWTPTGKLRKSVAISICLYFLAYITHTHTHTHILFLVYAMKTYWNITSVRLHYVTLSAKLRRYSYSRGVRNLLDLLSLTFFPWMTDEGTLRTNKISECM
jgi:hypothetical protein